MTQIIEEKNLEDYPLPVTIQETNYILDQMKNCICKIENENGQGTGFFCNISYKNKKYEVMITNNHIINEEIIKKREKIKVSLNDGKEKKFIEIMNKKIYTSKEYDTTIIEINNKDNIDKYLEIDEEIFEENYIYYKSIYTLQYPTELNDQKVAVSYGIMKNIDKYKIQHYCCTSKGSSGSPILKLSNKKVIGIHKGTIEKFNYNRGIYLKYPINEYINDINTIINNEIINKELKNNEINMTIEIGKVDVNKDIYFLDNTDGCSGIDGIEHHHDNLKELKESNVELFIDNKKYKYNKYFKPEKEGIYKIKLKINTIIKDCSFMFYNCSKLTDIDLSSFDTKNNRSMSNMFYLCSKLENINLSSLDTKNVTNMKELFYHCKKLVNINLSSFDTKKVTNMRNMFFGCHNLKDINLTSFNTKNVKDMNYMFSDCPNLMNIDLSSFDTEKVKDMSGMFSGCSKLTNIDLSSFDTKNVTSMSHMFSGCFNLTNINLSSFDTRNVNSMSDMFSGCSKITNIDLSSFDTKNVNYMSRMFYGCTELTNINLSSFDTKNVNDMNRMFSGCSNLINIDLSSFETKIFVNMLGIFDNCSKLNKVIINNNSLDSSLIKSLNDYNINISQNFDNY